MQLIVLITASLARKADCLADGADIGGTGSIPRGGFADGASPNGCAGFRAHSHPRVENKVLTTEPSTVRVRLEVAVDAPRELRQVGKPQKKSQVISHLPHFLLKMEDCIFSVIYTGWLTEFM